MSSSIKRELREQISHEISALPDDYIAASDNGLYLQVTSLKEFINARNIMIYYSVKREPSTLEIAKAALSMGKIVAFPRCYKDGIMQARVVSDLNELCPAVLGIPAPTDSAAPIDPQDLELVIVPALAYDRSGYRLGYGAGYYDRYLLKTSAFTVGLARDRLLKDELPKEPHDVAVKCLATEKGSELVAQQSR
ncbi:MAG: 5-formyltetrahydrofolate cyclo-ligase [Oscillospiraceae bacterium]|jgi:5-formyltetrahydrofolate cyclo-ligase|nr:5-formyltetrahydrofolate cyclo-ligase [Oscillospiraceae bacterium]